MLNSNRRTLCAVQALQRQHHMGQHMQMATLGSSATSAASTVSTST